MQTDLMTDFSKYSPFIIYLTKKRSQYQMQNEDNQNLIEQDDLLDDELWGLEDEGIDLSFGDQEDEEQMQQQVNAVPKKTDMSTENEEKVPISLKGLKQIISITDNIEQFRKMMEYLNNTGTESIFVSEPPEDPIKLDSNVKLEKLEEGEERKLKIEETFIHEDQNRRELPKQEDGKLIILRNQHMLSNFNNYGYAIYYIEVLGEDSSNEDLSDINRQNRVRIGLVYGFTWQMRLVIFSVFCLYKLPKIRMNDYSQLLMIALMQQNQADGCKLHPEITFFAHRFIDIGKLKYLAQLYKEEVEQSEGVESFPVYSFLLDPSFAMNIQSFMSADVPQKEEIQQILLDLLRVSSRQEFNRALGKMNLFLMDEEISQCQISTSGCTLRQFMEIFMQDAQYVCLSQITASLGICEFYFRAHPDYRHGLLAATKEEMTSFSIEILRGLAGTYGHACFNSNILLFVSLCISDRLCTQQQEQHRTILNKNYNLLGRNQHRLLEDEVPQLRFLKYQIAQIPHQYLLEELMDCPRWEVLNSHVQRGIHYMHIEIQEQDELFYQQYKALPIQVQRVATTNTDCPEYFSLIRKDRRWRCECGHSQRYGLPCVHELKLCLMTNTLIREQINESYIDEEYYDRCVEDKTKLEAKIQSLKRKTVKVFPIGTPTGRNELINHRVNSRKFCKKSDF